jgi:Protein of unknown function DUF72
MHLTTDFTYFRWHGRGEKIWFDYRYSNEELDPWVTEVQQASKSVKKVIGFFNNHYHGYAPKNCLYMLQQLGLLTEPKRKLKTNQRLSKPIYHYFSVKKIRPLKNSGKLNCISKCSPSAWWRLLMCIRAINRKNAPSTRLRSFEVERKCCCINDRFLHGLPNATT